MMNILLDWANVHCVFVLDGKYYMHSVHKREREREEQIIILKDKVSRIIEYIEREKERSLS